MTKAGNNPMSTSIRIDNALYVAAREQAKVAGLTIAAQIELWANLGRIALDNPDLPANFIAESLLSIREPRAQAADFVPRRSK